MTTRSTIKADVQPYPKQQFQITYSRVFSFSRLWEFIVLTVEIVHADGEVWKVKAVFSSMGNIQDSC